MLLKPTEQTVRCQTSLGQTGMTVFRQFHILAAGIVLVIVRLIISSITQECAWETRKKALFWQLSTPGARSQAPLQAHPLLLGLGNLTPYFIKCLSSIKHKKNIHFPDLTFWPFNMSVSSKYFGTSWSEKLWTFYDKKLWHWRKNPQFYMPLAKANLFFKIIYRWSL